MTVFYTRKGDKGKSKIGSRSLPKDNILFQFLGELDELSCWLGLCKADARGNRGLKELVPLLGDIQQSLFVAQAEVAAIGSNYKPRIRINADKIEAMEKIIDDVNSKLPPIKKFVIPGGSKLSSRIDLARAVARRVERNAVVFSRKNKLGPELMRYLNRLSSLLFALARLVNYNLKIKEENPSYK
jgi:cob(I)alamin adenosyltransferase